MTPDEERNYIRDDLRSLDATRGKLEKILRLFPYELVPIESTIQKLHQYGEKFFDITFPPTDSSAYRYD
jgi:hypothetical protein